MFALPPPGRGWILEILAFAAASMIYIAVADLIPGLQKRTAIGEYVMQVLFIALGIGFLATNMVLLRGKGAAQ